MARVSRQEKEQRVDQIYRLLLAFASPRDIRRFAVSQGWNISDRQLRRYIRAAHKQFEKAATQQRQRSRGRHIKQVEALAQRTLKDANQGIHLRTMQELAKLQGFHAAPRGAAAHRGDDPLKAPVGSSSVLRSARIARQLAAQARGDAEEIRLFLEAMPLRFFRVPDTTLPIWQLYVLEQCHLAGQLEQLCVFLLATTQSAPEPDRILCGQLAVYRLATAEAGWRQFLDHHDLVDAPLDGANANLWGEWRERILAMAPSGLALAATIRSLGLRASRLATAADFADRWKKAYALVASS